MFIFKREPVVEDFDTGKFKKIVGTTVEEMLKTREETVYFLDEHDLVLIFSWEFDHLEGSLYKWSEFQTSLEEGSSIYNESLYTEKRYIYRKDDNLVTYIDDEKIKDFSMENLKVFYCMCELIRLYDIQVDKRGRYRCIWS